MHGRQNCNHDTPSLKRSTFNKRRKYKMAISKIQMNMVWIYEYVMCM